MNQIIDILTKILEHLPNPPDQQSIPQNESIVQPVDSKPTSPQVLIPIKKEINFVSSNTKRLVEEDFVNAAQLLNVEVAAIKAVTSVESSGGGYLPSARPKILFEALYFHNLTKGKYDQTYPSISEPKWDRALYKGGEKEYDRLSLAIGLDQEAALKSASWGLFQIMGANYKACGFDSVYDFVQANVESEANHLKAFIGFIKTNKLDVALRDCNWPEFARKYNGPGYAKNSYHTKLQEAYNKFKTP